MFTRILVPTDFTATADAALSYARVLAGRFGASLELLHVLESPLVATLGDAMVFPEAPELRAAMVEDARIRLRHRSVPHAADQPMATMTVVPGKAAATIIEYAAKHGHSLIVMGTHGRRGMAHLLVGSVAEHVVRSAPCPVLTVGLQPALSTEGLTSQNVAGAEAC